MRRVILKDIAQAMGVSIALISCALNDKPDGYGNVSIKPEMRQKIKDKAKEMGYRPNRQARALKVGSSKLIGIVTPHSENPLVSHRILGITGEILHRGFDYIIQQISSTDYERFKKALELFMDYGVQGIILMSSGFEFDSSKKVQGISQYEIPIVEMSSRSHGEYPSVMPDFYMAAFQLASTVIRNGRKNIAFVGMDEASMTVSVRERLSGVKDACAQFEGISLNCYSTPIEYRSLSEIKQGYHSTIDIISRGKPDFIFYTNDSLALGGAHALDQSGINVPEDICICGVDGLEVVSVAHPPITTIEQPVMELALKTVEVLFDMIEDRKPITKEYYRIPCRLIFRESTGVLTEIPQYDNWISEMNANKTEVVHGQES